MREKIIDTIVDGLKNDSDTLSFWEQGSNAFGRVDALSDIDLQLIVKDAAVGAIIEKVELILESLGPVEAKYILPQPTWHGNWQGFYRLKSTSPYLLIDLVILKETSLRLFTEPEVHGPSRIFFDRTGRVGKEKVDFTNLKSTLRERLIQIHLRIDLFHIFVDKEAIRNHAMDALAFYQSLVLQSLVETLRIIHCPERHNFGLRYLEYDLPEDVALKLKDLCFVKDLCDLQEKKGQALAWLREVLSQQGVQKEGNI